MIFDLSNPLQKASFKAKVEMLCEQEKKVELTVKAKKRSISQNSYLHLIFSWFAIETGYTTTEVKQEIFKKVVNSDIFYEGEFEVKEIKIERWRSTADLTTSEMTLAIDRFRTFASKDLGIYLPEPKELALLEQLEFEIKKRSNKEFLNQ